MPPLHEDNRCKKCNNAKPTMSKYCDDCISKDNQKRIVSKCNNCGSEEHDFCTLLFSKDASNPKEEVEEKCYSCGGKGTYSQIHGEEGFEDFGGEGYIKVPSIHNHPCSACNGTGLKPTPPLEVKEGSKDREPTFTLSGRCEEGVEGCTRLGYHSHTSKDIDTLENYFYRYFSIPDWDNIPPEIKKSKKDFLEEYKKSLLSQQEAKIKKELVDEIENIMKGMSPILFFGDSKNHLSDVEKQKIVLENALSNIKKLLSE